MSNKKNTSDKYKDAESIFIAEFKKMMKEGITVKKFNKRIGYKYCLIKMQPNNKHYEIQKSNSKKKIVIELTDIKKIEIYEKKKMRLNILDCELNIELCQEVLANIFKDGTELLIKEIKFMKSVFAKLLTEIETDSESEDNCSIGSKESKLITINNLENIK